MRMRDLSSPLATSEFDSDKPKRRTVTKEKGVKTVVKNKKDGSTVTKTISKDSSGKRVKTKTTVTAKAKAMHAAVEKAKAEKAAKDKAAAAAAALKARNKQRTESLRKNTTSGTSTVETSTKNPITLVNYYKSQGMSEAAAVKKMKQVFKDKGI